MPPESVEEATSTSGEPSNKRPRLGEDTPDRISISSESEESVVITDESDVQFQEIVEENTEKEGDDYIDTDAEPEQQDNDSNLKTSDENEMTEVCVIVENIEDKNNTVDSTETEQDEGQAKTISDEAVNIYDAKTQIALNSSTDAIEYGHNIPVSMEITYDIPTTESKAPEKMDDEDLPSTNDSDDMQITCGQVIVNSQESDPTKDNVEVEDDNIFCYN